MNQSTNNNQGERIEPLDPVNATIERNTHWITLGLLAVLVCMYSPTVRHIMITVAEFGIWVLAVLAMLALVQVAKQVVA
jgi:hypothetical protein